VYHCIDHFVKVNFMATYEKIHFSVVSAFLLGGVIGVCCGKKFFINFSSIVQW